MNFPSYFPSLWSVFTRVLVVCAVLLGSLALAAGSADSQLPPSDGCHNDYFPCIPPGPGDLNCSDLSTGVWLYNISNDPYGLDADKDGDGCESLGLPGPPRISPIGKFRGKAVNGREVTVRGWGIDPNVVGPIRIVVKVNGKNKRNVGAHRNLKAPIPGWEAYGPNHGFQVKFNLGKGVHRVCVRALNKGRPAPHTNLGCRKVRIQ
jgi:hypothetical protein